MLVTNYIFTNIDIETGAIEQFETEEDIIEAGYNTDDILECVAGLTNTYKGKIWMWTEDLVLESMMNVLFGKSEEI